MSKVYTGIKSALRLTKTAYLVGNTGLSWIKKDRPPTPKLLRQLFERLGTTYIKLGQFIASSPSFFPEEYVEEFQHCLDNTPPVLFSVIAQRIQEELKQPIYQIFKTIDPTPLASASIAQVHAATLINNEDVVIKVQKPGVQNILLTDMNFLYASARLLELLSPNLAMASLSEIIEEIQTSMLAECDFYQEAQNMRDFQRFLQETNNTQVITPKIYEHASSLKVLTMERIYGTPFTSLEQVRHDVADPQQSLINAMNTWFSSVLTAPSFHADVHAGNLFALSDGRVAFIDFGIVGRINPNTWTAITQFINAITLSDFAGMAQAMVDIGMTKGSIDVKQLAEDIQSLYLSMERFNTPKPENDTSLDQEINHLLMKTIGLGKQHGIHFPREFALLLKQILYFDRYLQLLAPDVDIFSDNRFSALAEVLQ